MVWDWSYFKHLRKESKWQKFHQTAAISSHSWFALAPTPYWLMLFEISLALHLKTAWNLANSNLPITLSVMTRKSGCRSAPGATWHSYLPRSDNLVCWIRRTNTSGSLWMAVSLSSLTLVRLFRPRTWGIGFQRRWRSQETWGVLRRRCGVWQNLKADQNKIKRFSKPYKKEP